MLEEGNIIQAYHVTLEEFKTDYDTWYLDIGATHHLTYRRDWLEDYQVLSNQLQVIFGDKGKKSAIGKGTIKIKLSKDHQITVHNVYYVPGLAKHLLSVGQATIDGLTIQFCRDKAILQFQDGNSSIQMVCPKEQHLYPVHNQSTYALVAPVQTKKQLVHLATDLWHCLFGHVNISALQQCEQLKRMKGLLEIGFKAILYVKAACSERCPISHLPKARLLQNSHFNLFIQTCVGHFLYRLSLEQGISFHLLIILPDSQ